MAKGARAGLAGETMAGAAEGAVHRRLTRKAASAKVAPGESARTAGVEAAAMEATAMEAWRAAHPDAAAVRRRRVKAAARVESASAHAHAATTHVEAAATTHVEATTAAAVESTAAATHVEATTTAAAVSTSTAPVSAATAATPGGRRIGREGGNHGHARQKGEGKLVFHVTPSSCSALPAICIKDTRPRQKPSERRSGFRARQ
jgi:hypothetical protein